MGYVKSKGSRKCRSCGFDGKYNIKKGDWCYEESFGYSNHSSYCLSCWKDRLESSIRSTERSLVHKKERLEECREHIMKQKQAEQTDIRLKEIMKEAKARGVDPVELVANASRVSSETQDSEDNPEGTNGEHFNDACEVVS